MIRKANTKPPLQSTKTAKVRKPEAVMTSPKKSIIYFFKPGTGKLFEECKNPNNEKQPKKSKKPKQSQSKSIENVDSYYDDDGTVIEAISDPFAIKLPEYLIRFDDECDTIFEKIETKARPANHPLPLRERDDEETVFQRIQSKMKPVNAKMRTRKLVVAEKSTMAPPGEIVAKKNIIMTDIHGKKVRVVTTMRKGNDDNPLAYVADYLARKRGEVVKKPKPPPPVAETWEDIFGNILNVTDEMKKLKTTTEEEVRKTEDKMVADKRINQATHIANLSRADAMHKKELKKEQEKPIKILDQKELIKVLEESKEDLVAEQHTQYSDDSPPRRRTRRPVAPKKVTLKKEQKAPTPAQPVLKFRINDSEVVQKEAEEEKNKEEKNEEEKKEDATDEQKDEGENEANKDDDQMAASEYLTTTMDYYSKGQLMSRPRDFYEQYYLRGRY